MKFRRWESQTKEIVSSLLEMGQGIRLIAVIYLPPRQFLSKIPFPPPRKDQASPAIYEQLLHGGKVLILTLLHFLFIFPSPPLLFLLLHSFLLLFFFFNTNFTRPPSLEPTVLTSPKSFFSFHTTRWSKEIHSFVLFNSAPPSRYPSSVLSQAISIRTNNNFRTTCTQQQYQLPMPSSSPPSPPPYHVSVTLILTLTLTLTLTPMRPSPSARPLPWSSPTT